MNVGVMSGLSTAPVPRIGQVTVGEKNGEFVHENAIYQKGKKGNRIKFPEYRRYDLTGAALKSPQSLACDVKQSAFIAQDDKLFYTLFETWEVAGFKGVANQLSESSKIPGIIKQVSYGMLQLFLLLQKTQEKLTSKSKVLEAKMTDSHSLIPNRSNSIIKAFAVHPHINSFAIAFKDDVVRILSANRLNDFEPILKDKRQTDVACLAFRPLSSANIAIGCKSGIMFWILDPNTSGVRPGANQNRFFSHVNHSPVTSLAWSGDGHLLASGSPADSSIVIWDVLSQRSTPLRRFGPGTGFLAWSPCQDCLFASTVQDMFRIWEAKSWTCEKWSNLNGRCQVACWSPCEKYLLFTVENESSLYYLYFQKNQGSNGLISTANSIAVKCFDFSEYSWETETGDIRIGGDLQSMTWDTTGSRLAMTFKDKGDAKTTQSHIGIFRTTLEPVFEILPCGFVTGHAEEKPLAISFLPNFDKGALLMVCWSSGMLSQVPLLFHKTNSTPIPNQDVSTFIQETEDVSNILQSITD